MEYTNTHKVKKKHGKKKAKIFICLAVFSALCLMFLSFVVNPIIIESSDAQVKALSQRAIENAVYELIETKPLLYDSLIEITKNKDGDVVLITSNSLQINALARELSQSSQKKLENFGKNGIKIPLGNLSGLPILAGRGPKLDITISPIGSASCKFRTEFSSAGINQTNHKIYLKVTSNLALILPTVNRTIITESEVLIAESVIVGKIPEFYFNSSKLDNMLNLIP